MSKQLVRRDGDTAWRQPARFHPCPLLQYGFAGHPVDFQAASGHRLTESETNVKTATHMDVDVSLLIAPRTRSFVIPNMTATLVNSSWLINPVGVRV